MKSSALLIALLVCSLCGACAMAEETPPPVEPDSDAAASEQATALDDKRVLYVLGMALAREMATFDFNEEEVTEIQAGLADTLLRQEPRHSPDVYGPQIQAMLEQRLALVVERHSERGFAFATDAAAEPGAEVTASGLVYRELEPGDGPAPVLEDTVLVHYRARRHDGSIFDTTFEGDTPEPTEFVLGEIILCFSEGIRKMKVGGKSRLTCPPALAYGDSGAVPDIAPGETIQFDIELVEIVPGASPAETSGGEPTTEAG